MGRSVKFRQTIIILGDVASGEWTQALPLSFVPDEVIVREVHYMAHAADGSVIGFITADFLTKSNRSLLCNFSPKWIVTENTTFDGTGLLVADAQLTAVAQVSNPNSHFMFNKECSGSTVTFRAVIDSNGILTPTPSLLGDIAIHLEFVSYAETK